jgi:clan AA aspartic protease (TIGR02281 family)
VKKQFLIFLGAAAIVIYGSMALADPNMEAGIKCYKKKDYKDALVHFQKALKSNPHNYNAMYYSAITYHCLGFTAKAVQTYGKLILSYPNTDAANNAIAALNYLDPKYLHKIHPLPLGQSGLATPSASPAHTASPRGVQQFTANGSDLDRLPDDCKVYFEPQGNNLLIDAYVNNRPLKMLFDTGAEAVVIGKNHLQELGIQAPEGAATGFSYGVGAGGAQKTWQTRATIKIGQIERQNFPIIVQENMPTLPLLGQTFFKDFQYSIERGMGDNGNGSIHFRKKASSQAGASNGSETVPFIRQGNEMVVSVQINGKTTPMYFDTGAEHCVFSATQLERIGVQVPDDAQVGMSMGIAGATRTRIFTIARMRLGNVEKTDVPVSVVDDYKMAFPLLGQTFFGDLRYELDNQAHALKIRR